MSLVKRAGACAGLLLLSVVVSGCGKRFPAGPESRESAVLGEIYDMYSTYVKSNRKPPERLDHLKQFQAVSPMGYQSVKSGEYVVVWGTKAAKGGKAVLAYEKTVPEKGGPVLLSNGKVKDMTAAEFQAAKGGAGSDGG